MEILIKAAQLLLSLSILVILHEFGHYIPAVLFKTRVEKFYLFFDPWFSLYKKKVKDTEWGIGWLPLGGYVKISGMIDESMDKEQLAQPAQPWEFRSKKAWQRLIIMSGGVFVNLILGMFIYICLVFSYGEDKLSPNDLKNGIAVHPYLNKYGIESGDNILKINDAAVEDVLTEPNTKLMLQDGRKLTVKKADGAVKTISLPEGIEKTLFQQGAMSIFSPRVKGVKIGAIEDETPAKKAGLKVGDIFTAVNNQPITYFDELQTVLFQSKGKKIKLEFERKGEKQIVELLIPKTGKYEGKIGFANGMDTFEGATKIKHINYTFGESIVRGIQKGKNTIVNYVAQFKFVFTKKGASSVGGFASMGKMFPSTWNWEAFWGITAFFSIALAFMNILPIPALDGGHIVFLIYEIITGREAPQKVLEVAQIIGITLLLGLMLYANGNDVVSWFTK